MPGRNGEPGPQGRPGNTVSIDPRGNDVCYIDTHGNSVYCIDPRGNTVYCMDPRGNTEYRPTWKHCVQTHVETLCIYRPTWKH